MSELPISIVDPRHLTEKTNFAHMYSQPCSFGHYPGLVTRDEGWNTDQLVNQRNALQLSSFLTTTVKPKACITAEASLTCLSIWRSIFPLLVNKNSLLGAENATQPGKRNSLFSGHGLELGGADSHFDLFIIRWKLPQCKLKDTDWGSTTLCTKSSDLITEFPTEWLRSHQGASQLPWWSLPGIWAKIFRLPHPPRTCWMGSGAPQSAPSTARRCPQSVLVVSLPECMQFGQPIAGGPEHGPLGFHVPNRIDRVLGQVFNVSPAAFPAIWTESPPGDDQLTARPKSQS